MTHTLTPARFAIESSTGIVVVDGYHDPDYRWNGWAAPFLTNAAVDVLIARFNPDQGDARITRDGDEVHVVEESFPDEPEVIHRDTQNGVAVWAVGDAWCWTVATADDESAALTPTA